MNKYTKEEYREINRMANDGSFMTLVEDCTEEARYIKWLKNKINKKSMWAKELYAVLYGPYEDLPTCMGVSTLLNSVISWRLRIGK